MPAGLALPMFWKPPDLSLQPGDRFIKVEDPDTVWIVQRLVDLPGLPKHAELTTGRPKRRKIVLSSVALMDRHLYRKLKRNAESQNQPPGFGRFEGKP